VLWIQNYLVRIRIFRFEPGQLNNWQIVSVHNGIAAGLFGIGNMYATKDDLYHFEYYRSPFLGISFNFLAKFTRINTVKNDF
jgi:hypothetical protein